MNHPNQKPLIQLPNGTWVRPETVQSITPIKQEDPYQARVVVRYGDSNHAVISCEDNAHAQEVADQLSARVNQP